VHRSRTIERWQVAKHVAEQSPAEITGRSADRQHYRNHGIPDGVQLPVADGQLLYRLDDAVEAFGRNGTCFVQNRVPGDDQKRYDVGSSAVSNRH
jgi:hypothetical protein